ncbi:MAG: ester cyclase [Actinomycetota bacterium]
MAKEYETFMHRWFEEVWNQGREETIDEMLAEETILNGLNDAEGNPLVGTEGFKTMHRTFLAAFSDLTVTIEETVEEGDKIAARCTVRATHTGEGLGISPKNQRVEFTGLGIARIKDGKIIEVWNEFDFMKMYQQLGALTLNLQ